MLSGLVLGFIILVLALVLGQVSIGTLLNPEALIVVFGGTLTAVLTSFDLKSLRKALAAVVRPSSSMQQQGLRETIDYLGEIADYIRAEGILALQPMLHTVEIPLLRKGLEMIVDNRPEKLIHDRLSAEIEVAYREDLEPVRVFEAAAGFAPTMGIIGAVIGLMHVVNAFNNPQHLGHGVASAFSATLYGVALANLFLLPLAGRLKYQAREASVYKAVLFEGIMSIRAGEHPQLLRQKLEGFLPELERQPVMAWDEPSEEVYLASRLAKR
jgi:chemotaxis protein MotA